MNSVTESRREGIENINRQPLRLARYACARLDGLALEALNRRTFVVSSQSLLSQPQWVSVSEVFALQSRAILLPLFAHRASATGRFYTLFTCPVFGEIHSLHLEARLNKKEATSKDGLSPIVGPKG